uniref:NADH-ubiquinone oxidoreductase chain 2 n=1 Tax=Laimosemion kirovskyi TaxID=287867 RepID=Q671G4_9TELE|nr:NADH dehydrogenase subunit 2 [Laimosemion kirovskyi]
MNPCLLFLVVISLIAGTMITISSSHWLLAWVGLEISTFAILPLMAQKYHPRSMESTTKYFILQTATATLLLFASISNAWLTGQWDIQQATHPALLMIITVALAMKLGLAPLHAWFPEVLQGLTLTTGLILSTWQKLAPFSLMYQISTSNQTLLTGLGLTSILVGGWGGLSQTQLRKILGYSSVAHLGWIIMIMQYSRAMSFLAFMIYIVLTLSLFLIFFYAGSTTINSLSVTWTKAPLLSMIAPLILLSLGGLPPLTGFLPKWMILLELTKQNLVILATMAALFSLLSLYFYLRLSYSMTLITSPNNTSSVIIWRFNFNKNFFLLSSSIMMSLLLLPLTPSFLTLTFS